MTDSLSKCNNASHWISSLIDRNPIPWVKSPILSSVILLGGFPNIFFVLLALNIGIKVPEDWLIAFFFATLWLNIGPLLIWYYDERVLPKFFKKVSELIENKDRVTELNRKYNRWFTELYLIPALLWTILLLGLLFQTRSFLAAEVGIDVVSPAFIVFLIWVVYLGILTGIGFMGVITTVFCLSEIANEQIKINPLHPDGLAGLGNFGYFAIRTTVTFSSGSLLLPLSFMFIRPGESNVIIYLIVISYMLAIATSFLYPTYKINRQAQVIRESIINDLRQEYQQAKKEMKSVGDLHKQLNQTHNSKKQDKNSTGIQKNLPQQQTELIGQLELQRVRNEYQDYQNVRLYPFKIRIMIRLISSIILPFIFLLAETYLFT